METKSVEQQKILRVFKLINLLRSSVGKPVTRLAESLGTDKRTVYRYFQLLEGMGFTIEKEFGKFKISEQVEEGRNSLFGVFTEEEATFLMGVLNRTSNKNLLKHSIIQKVRLKSELEQSAGHLFSANLGLFVDTIAEAIKSKTQIVLRDYYSLSSDSVSDRLIEPVVFTNNYDAVYAFEIASRGMKTFKLERISEIYLTGKKNKYEKLHEPLKQGLFGFTGTDQFHVRLKLSKKAYQLLLEEHPDAKPFVQVEDRQDYIFEGKVPNLPGIARFILGLPGEIVVEEGDELIAYLKEQIKKAEFTFSAFD
ncbi:hypothetical protein GCM10007049_03270 [Echinicola pacifica]|uniref:WYL domain-containing protein n=1 Tax=Echinicola pacifica TaxID=346377 RepID=A0A918UJR3_9BACT|nr:WYL domain-containing protein [Echinicola pacifica]GGZ14698.1 hypothetical protein GCM10007049_03270 [Echinicola pacifica]